MPTIRLSRKQELCLADKAPVFRYCMINKSIENCMVKVTCFFGMPKLRVFRANPQMATQKAAII